MARRTFKQTGTTGLKSLEAKLKAMPGAARSRIRQAMAEAGDDVTGMMKRLAPVDSGDLRDSITATFGDGSVPKYAAFRARRQGLSRNSKLIITADPGLTLIITAGNSRVRYAHIVEFGSSPFISGGKFAGAKNPGVRAQPFFYPAYRAQRKRIKTKIGRAITQAAKDVAAGKI